MADQDLVETDSFTFTDSPGGVATVRPDITARESFRFTEVAVVQDAAVIPPLARPLYALIEQHHRTATVIDYSEVIDVSDWRETGFEVDISWLTWSW